MTSESKKSPTGLHETTHIEYVAERRISETTTDRHIELGVGGFPSPSIEEASELSRCNDLPGSVVEAGQQLVEHRGGSLPGRQVTFSLEEMTGRFGDVACQPLAVGERVEQIL